MRIKRGFSLKQIGKIVSLADSSISQIESGHTKEPAFSTVVKLAYAYDLSLDKLAAFVLKSEMTTYKNLATEAKARAEKARKSRLIPMNNEDLIRDALYSIEPLANAILELDSKLDKAREYIRSLDDMGRLKDVAPITSIHLQTKYSEVLADLREAIK